MGKTVRKKRDSRDAEKKAKDWLDGIIASAGNLRDALDTATAEALKSKRRGGTQKEYVARNEVIQTLKDNSKYRSESNLQDRMKAAGTEEKIDMEVEHNKQEKSKRAQNLLTAVTAAAKIPGNILNRAINKAAKKVEGEARTNVARHKATGIEREIRKKAAARVEKEVRERAKLDEEKSHKQTKHEDDDQHMKRPGEKRINNDKKLNTESSKKKKYTKNDTTQPTGDQDVQYRGTHNPGIPPLEPLEPIESKKKFDPPEDEVDQHMKVQGEKRTKPGPSPDKTEPSTPKSQNKRVRPEGAFVLPPYVHKPSPSENTSYLESQAALIQSRGNDPVEMLPGIHNAAEEAGSGVEERKYDKDGKYVPPPSNPRPDSHVAPPIPPTQKDHAQQDIPGGAFQGGRGAVGAGAGGRNPEFPSGMPGYAARDQMSAGASDRYFKRRETRDTNNASATPDFDERVAHRGLIGDGGKEIGDWGSTGDVAAEGSHDYAKPTLRPQFGQIGVSDAVPHPKAQMASDIEFDMFSVVPPGYGEGVDNKMYLYEKAHEDRIRFAPPFYSPGVWLGPLNTQQTMPWQWQTVKHQKDIDGYKNRVSRRIMDGTNYVRSLGESSSGAIGRDVPEYTTNISSSGLRRDRRSPFEPTIHNMHPWTPDVDPPGYALNRRGMKRLFSPWRDPDVRETQPDNGGPTLRKRRALEVIIP